MSVLFRSSPCLTGHHNECKDAACTCSCHPKPKSKPVVESHILDKRKLKVLTLTVYASQDWDKAKVEEWLDNEAPYLEMQLKNLIHRTETKGIIIKLESK